MTTFTSTASNSSVLVDRDSNSTVLLGNYAYETIQAQYRHMVRQEKKVLADQDPEPLHQMRVGSRRLRTALQVFRRVVVLPRSASERRLRTIAALLGRLRDLDVQLASLRDRYLHQIDPSEQEWLEQVLHNLRRQRRKVFAGTADVLQSSRYLHFKAAYEHWLTHPRWTTLADLPLSLVLPDLLYPLLALLLQHPGWLIGIDQAHGPQGVVLHDLRKLCKHVRYQCEFFAGFYDTSFKLWIAEIRDLQERLGRLQDTEVLQHLLAELLPRQVKLPMLEAAIRQEQQSALANWEQVRQSYLQPSYRHHLRSMIISRILPDERSTSLTQPLPFDPSSETHPT